MVLLKSAACWRLRRIEFLTDDGPFIGGAQKCGLAGIHANWIVKWLFQTLNIARDPSFNDADLPRVYRWIEAIPQQDEVEKKEMHLTAEEASKQILEAQYALPEIGVDSRDPLDLSQGEHVAAEMGDAKLGTHPQLGRLIGLNRVKTLLELGDGIRIHFPKTGYFVRKVTQDERA